MGTETERIETYRRMLSEHPDNDLARFSLGKALYDAQEWKEAVAVLHPAVVKKPDWMVVQILLGKCELALGNREGARAAFARARDLAMEQQHEGPLMEIENLLADL